MRPVQKYNVTYGFEKERCEYIYILSLRNIYHNCEIVIYHGEETLPFHVNRSKCNHYKYINLIIADIRCCILQSNRITEDEVI